MNRILSVKFSIPEIQKMPWHMVEDLMSECEFSNIDVGLGIATYEFEYNYYPASCIQTVEKIIDRYVDKLNKELEKLDDKD